MTLNSLAQAGFDLIVFLARLVGFNRNDDLLGPNFPLHLYFIARLVRFDG